MSSGVEWHELMRRDSLKLLWGVWEGRSLLLRKMSLADKYNWRGCEGCEQLMKHNWYTFRGLSEMTRVTTPDVSLGRSNPRQGQSVYLKTHRVPRLLLLSFGSLAPR